MLAQRAWGTIRRFRKDETGAVAIYFGLLGTVLVGGFGLAAETGLWYFKQRELQHAADVAAMAAANTRFHHDTTTAKEWESAALSIAKSSGPVHLTPADMKLNLSPQYGYYKGGANLKTGEWAMELILEQEIVALFSAVLGGGPKVKYKARAVAASLGAGGSGCVLGLNGTKVGTVTVSGSSTVTLDGCDVISNSEATDSFDFVGAKGKLYADCVRAAGTVDSGTTKGKSVESTQLSLKCGSPLQGADPIPDPIKTKFTAPTVTGSCPTGGAFYKCGNWSPGSGTLAPGVYVIDGGKFIVNATDILRGSDVTFYLINGAQVQFNGGADIQLSAPTQGSLKGILFWAAEGNTAGQSINGNSNSKFDGTFYAPSGKILWNGNGGQSGCPQLIADQIEFQGDANTQIKLDDDCKSKQAVEIKTLSQVALVE